MSDFVAKPVEPSVLYEVLVRWLPVSSAEPGDRHESTAAAPASAHAETATSESPIFDDSVLLGALDGDHATYREILATFIATHAGDAAEIVDLVRADEFVRLGRLMHKLRGAAGSIGALALKDQTLAVESAIRLGAPPEVVRAGAQQAAETAYETIRVLGRTLGDEPAPRSAP